MCWTLLLVSAGGVVVVIEQAPGENGPICAGTARVDAVDGGRESKDGLAVSFYMSRSWASNVRMGWVGVVSSFLFVRSEK